MHYFTCDKDNFTLQQSNTRTTESDTNTFNSGLQIMHHTIKSAVVGLLDITTYSNGESGWISIPFTRLAHLKPASLGSAVSSSSGVRDRAPAAVAFCCIVGSRMASPKVGSPVRPNTSNIPKAGRADRTRKPSCRWQTRVMLAKSLHGLRKSSGIVSCIAIGCLLTASLWCPITSYIVTVSVKCVALEILAF